MNILGKLVKNKALRSHNRFYFAIQKSSLYNPYNMQFLSDKDYLSDDELYTKISYATASFRKWKKVELEERIRLVKQFVASVLAERDQLKPYIAAELGKSFRDIDAQYRRIDYIAQSFIESGRTALQPQIIEETASKVKKVVYEPIGLSLIFPYYCEPIFDSLINLIPCLIAGNGALIKPSDFNHFLGGYLEKKAAEIFKMDNLITELFIHPSKLEQLSQFRSIKKVLYAGSSESAKHIFQTLIRRRFIDCNLFFGGKDAAYVDSTADLQCAAKEIVKSAFYNNGQSYDCIKRVYIDEPIESQFIQLLVQEIQKLKLGNPTDSESDLGPLCVAENASLTETYITDSISSGAKCQVGGLTTSDGVESGIFFEPTLLSNCTNDMPVVQTQIHAPVLCAITANIETAAQEINASQYGTGVRIFTKQTQKYQNIIKELQVGKISFNSGSLFCGNLPIQGWKRSGKGKLLSELSYEQFSLPKSYNIKHL